MKNHVATLGMLILIGILAFAIIASSENNTVSQSNASANTDDYRGLFLNIAIILMALVLCGAEILVLINTKQGWGPNAVRVIAVTLIVTTALLALTSGVGTSQQNLAPLWGLLGTIAGYVLGVGEDDKKEIQDLKEKMEELDKKLESTPSSSPNP